MNTYPSSNPSNQGQYVPPSLYQVPPPQPPPSSASAPYYQTNQYSNQPPPSNPYGAPPSTVFAGVPPQGPISGYQGSSINNVSAANGYPGSNQGGNQPYPNYLANADPAVYDNYERVPAFRLSQSQVIILGGVAVGCFLLAFFIWISSRK
eukprot:TRINITY_DN9086_c0_g1_i1.p1 TRINITY_DN9086_c0_g1~~TRINITY_DN9086_c0_g1_i1.p1  ORF type:complete len:150 (-),score=17.92 TRINITY_DN9086_c0_g1_i1:191-640(-)